MFTITFYPNLYTLQIEEIQSFGLVQSSLSFLLFSEQFFPFICTLGDYICDISIIDLRKPLSLWMLATLQWKVLPCSCESRSFHASHFLYRRTLKGLLMVTSRVCRIEVRSPGMMAGKMWCSLIETCFFGQFWGCTFLYTPKCVMCGKMW